MSFIQKIKRTFSELKTLKTILKLSREELPFLVYSEDIETWNQVQGYIDLLLEKHQQKVLYITSALGDPLLETHHPKMKVHSLRETIAQLVPNVDAELFFTTMPDLGQLHVPRTKKETELLYTFHSLNSIHEVYRKGAFDHYDSFFCTGPHHKKELTRQFENLGKTQPVLLEVGYYKLDRVANSYMAYQKQHPDQKTVLIAPSWGDANLLESHGEEIVGQLLSMGLRVIVRPHPCFFLPIYPQGIKIVEALQKTYQANEHFILEENIHTETSFYEADLMISDFSGAAFEYALGTLRPVLFLDVARKTKNPDWRDLELPTFEDIMRKEVGEVLSPKTIQSFGQKAEELLLAHKSWEKRLAQLRETSVYNFGKSSEVGAMLIKDRLKTGKWPS